MQRLVVHQLGPVKHCELDINNFMIFTGPQASGKSTIAKSIFFFQNIKNLLAQLMRKQFMIHEDFYGDVLELSVKDRLIREVRSNFLQIFGSSWHMDNSMYISFQYAENIQITVSLKSDTISPNYIWVEFSKDLVGFLKSMDKYVRNDGLSDGMNMYFSVQKQINSFFQDDMEIVYIPAGRSMITLLSTQLSYIYSSMDDTQKKNLDYCTQNYLERILQLKPGFSDGIGQMIENQKRLTDAKIDKEILINAANLMREILMGEYRNVNGEERLMVSKEHYVKINFASSGQQEAVWILNVIFYYLLNNKKTYFIIEEPESHLFPNSQKHMAEFIALAKNRGRNKIFITTHSPYILGTINNLLYAKRISKIVASSEVEKIIPENTWIAAEDMSAFYVRDGFVRTCVDEEFGTIENEVIDGASEDINDDYEKMVDLKEQ